MVGKLLKNSNDILVNQRISALVFTVAGSQTIVVLHSCHCRSNSPESHCEPSFICSNIVATLAVLSTCCISTFV